MLSPGPATPIRAISRWTYVPREIDQEDFSKDSREVACSVCHSE